MRERNERRAIWVDGESKRRQCPGRSRHDCWRGTGDCPVIKRDDVHRARRWIGLECDQQLTLVDYAHLRSTATWRNGPPNEFERRRAVEPAHAVLMQDKR